MLLLGPEGVAAALAVAAPNCADDGGGARGGEAEGLALVRAGGSTGFKGVHRD